MSQDYQYNLSKFEQWTKITTFIRTEVLVNKRN